MWQRAGYIERLPGYRHGLGHLQAFWRTDLALPPIKRFLATLTAAAGG